VKLNWRTSSDSVSVPDVAEKLDRTAAYRNAGTTGSAPGRTVTHAVERKRDVLEFVEVWN
jgi:hypothetical protein